MRVLLITLSLSVSGCTLQYVYASDRYIDKIIDVCDGRVHDYSPRNGKVVCRVQVPTQINGGS